MQDIFENKEFFLGEILDFSKNFYLLLLFFLYFFIKYIFNKYFKKNKKINKIEKIDFLEKLENISEKYFLNEIFSLYLVFLEQKIGEKNIYNYNFSEIKKINLEKKFIKFYEEIYFLKYKNINLQEKEKLEIKEKFKKILKSNL